MFSDYKNSPTFCVHPWVEMVVQPSGRISYCCLAEGGGDIFRDDGSAHEAAVDTLEKAWSSKHMRGIREQMLKGEKVAGCKRCYFQESIGKYSYRQMHNDEWFAKKDVNVEQRITDSIKHDLSMQQPPAYLDLRLGNQCNLKCRSCVPTNSQPIYAEYDQLVETNPEFQKLWERHNRSKRPRNYLKMWAEDPSFWNELYSFLPQLRKLYLTGGEPTLIRKNLEFLKYCVESGHSKHIFLMLNTNGAFLSDEFLSYLPHFEYVLINFSIDGFEKINSYIRYPSKWDNVDSNLRKALLLGKNVQIGVTPVVQIYSILNIADLLRYVDRLAEEYNANINVDFLYATDPSYLDAAILPKKIKDIAILRLKEFAQSSTLISKNSYLQNSVASCINFLGAQSPEDSEFRLSEFWFFTKTLDDTRKQKFSLALPQLHDLMSPSVEISKPL